MALDCKAPISSPKNMATEKSITHGARVWYGGRAEKHGEMVKPKPKKDTRYTASCDHRFAQLLTVDTGVQGNTRGHRKVEGMHTDRGEARAGGGKGGRGEGENEDGGRGDGKREISVPRGS